MYAIVFLYSDGTTHGHICANKTVRNNVLQDVMHHAGEHVKAWRGADNTGWDIASDGVVDAYKLITQLPEHMRVEWS